MNHHTYYIDRDPRPKSHPCRYCARDVEVGRVCICAPVQVRAKPAAEVHPAYNTEGHEQAVSRLTRTKPATQYPCLTPGCSNKATWFAVGNKPKLGHVCSDCYLRLPVDEKKDFAR